jgi:uncharacterized protein (TIGR02466 family)
MENNYKIIDLFPTPLFTTQIPSQYSSVITVFDKQEMGGNLGQEFEYGKRSKNSYVLNDPNCLKFKEYLLTQITYFANQILSYDYDSYKITQSWLTFKYPNESHVSHSHPNSLISGVFYYGDIDNLTSQIIFYKGNSYPDSQFLLLPKYKHERGIHSYTEYHYKPSPGSLILFPSYLRHSVPVNTTNKIRKSLAFNVVPTEGFGDEVNLTELKFN